MTVITTLPIIWLAVILAAIFCEAVFENLVAIWLAPSAMASLICGWLDVSVRGQVVVFLVCGVLLITVSRIIMRVIGKGGARK